jgi:predicted nucleic acid-binding protein
LTKAALDSSVIIALSTLGYLNKLKPLFEEIIIAKAVYEEICSAGQGLVGDSELEEAIKNHLIEIKEVKNQILVIALSDSLANGEAETIALALDEHADQIVLDDKAARRKAKALKLNVIGTLRVLRMMYDTKIISKIDLITALEKLEETGFRISKAIIDKVKDEL